MSIFGQMKNEIDIGANRAPLLEALQNNQTSPAIGQRPMDPRTLPTPGQQPGQAGGMSTRYAGPSKTKKQMVPFSNQQQSAQTKTIGPEQKKSSFTLTDEERRILTSPTDMDIITGSYDAVLNKREGQINEMIGSVSESLPNVPRENILNAVNRARFHNQPDEFISMIYEAQTNAVRQGVENYIQETLPTIQNPVKQLFFLEQVSRMHPDSPNYGKPPEGFQLKGFDPVGWVDDGIEKVGSFVSDIFSGTGDLAGELWDEITLTLERPGEQISNALDETYKFVMGEESGPFSASYEGFDKWSDKFQQQMGQYQGNLSAWMQKQGISPELSDVLTKMWQGIPGSAGAVMMLDPEALMDNIERTYIEGYPNLAEYIGESLPGTLADFGQDSIDFFKELTGVGKIKPGDIGIGGIGGPGSSGADVGTISEDEMSLVNALSARARGEGPSIAGMQTEQLMDELVRGQTAAQLSNRGVFNPALTGRNVQRATEQAAAELPMQRAIARQQEQQAAEQQLAQVLQKQREDEIKKFGITETSDVERQKLLADIAKFNKQNRLNLISGLGQAGSSIIPALMAGA